MGLRKMTMGKFPWNERCKICGQYILEGEEIYIVYPSHDNNETLTWGIVHAKELDDISEGLSEEEKMDKLRGMKKPRFKGFTEEQKNNAELFKELCFKRGFRKHTLSKRTLKFSKRGTSFKITYDMITENISYDYRHKGLFDGLFIMQIISELKHEFEKLQGKVPCKIVTVGSIINDALEKTNELMGIK